MVRNMGKGGKGHKRMKNSGLSEGHRELIFKNYDQEYAIVTEMLGHNRCKIRCPTDSLDKLGIIRGSMRRKQIYRIGRSDVVLVGLRAYQADKVDIIHVYHLDEVNQLINYEEIDQQFLLCQSNCINCVRDTTDDIVFSDI